MLSPTAATDTSTKQWRAEIQDRPQVVLPDQLAAAYVLYKTARELADLHPDDTLIRPLHRYRHIANFCASKCRKVVGIEYVPEAIEDARHNSEINGIENTVFYAGDMKRVLDDEFVARNGRRMWSFSTRRVPVSNAPRNRRPHEGRPQAHRLRQLQPATQARDFAAMNRFYAVDAVQPVDMFPHTHHVENVVRLIRRDKPLEQPAPNAEYALTGQ